jgi:hypothetical protein
MRYTVMGGALLVDGAGADPLAWLLQLITTPPAVACLRRSRAWLC